MGATVSEKGALLERYGKTPLQGEILPDDPRRPDRKKIAFPPGKRAVTLSVPQLAHDSKQIPFVYHHNGNPDDSKVPLVFSDVSIKTGKEGYVVDFEPGRRDVEFTVSSGTTLSINLLGVNGRVRGWVRVEAGSDGDIVISAEGTRNRWLTIKEGTAKEVHMTGKDPGQDDDIRLIIGEKGIIENLYQDGNTGVETPGREIKDITAITKYIKNIRTTKRGNFLNDVDLGFVEVNEGETFVDNLQQYLARLKLGKPETRNHSDADLFHKPQKGRELYDDPQEYLLAQAAEEAEERWRLREPELRMRQEYALADEARYAEQVPPQVRRERRWPRFVSMLRRSSKDAEPSPAENHISLVTVDAHDRYLATIVMHAFHKAMIDYTDEDMRIALALAHVVTPTDQRPPAGRQATMVGEDGLRVIVGRDQHEAVRKAINTFMYGETNPSYKRIMHVSELAERKADGWDVIGEIDSILLQRAEEAAVQRELTAIKNSAATNVFIAPRHDAPPEVVPPARRRELAEAIA